MKSKRTSIIRVLAIIIVGFLGTGIWYHYEANQMHWYIREQEALREDQWKDYQDAEFRTEMERSDQGFIRSCYDEQKHREQMGNLFLILAIVPSLILMYNVGKKEKS
jgi:hypothetical protein